MRFRNTNGSSGNTTLTVASLGDAGKVLVGFAAGTSTSAFNLGSTAIAGLTFGTRQFELRANSLGLALGNYSGQTFTINTDLDASLSTTAKTLTLRGTGAGLSTFGGVISDGGSTLALTKTESGTWNVTNTSNSFTGGTTVSAGTLGFASGALGTTGTINASNGTLQWLTGNTQDISSRIATTAGFTTLDTNGNDVTFASAVGSGGFGVIKTGAGTLTLLTGGGYSGGTRVNGGTLTLDYTSNLSKINDGANITLGGGTLNLDGGSHTEIVGSTTLTAATGSFVTRTSGTSVLQMNAITNNTGTINFGAENIATTDNLNSATTGIIGTWATVGGDWAINSGSATSGGATVPGTGIADGFIRAYTGYTDVTRLASGSKAIANGTTTNVRIIDGTGGAGDNTVTGTIAINTLNQSATGGTSTISMANQTLRTDGILMGSGVGALTIGAAGGTAALSGTLTSTASNGSIIVTNNSNNLLTINSVIGINGASSSLVKTGTGVLVLTGLNSYTGGTFLQDGTIRVGTSNGSILGGVFNNGITIANKSTAVFDLANFDATIKDLIGGGSLGGNVTLGSGTLLINNPNNTYNGIISGTGNLSVNGSSGWTTTGAHTYTGITTIGSGNVAFTVSILADGGVASGIGQSTSAASNLVFTGTGASNPRVIYNSASDASTNRQFTLAGNAGFAVNAAGGVNWTSASAVTHSGAAAAKNILFTGNGTGIGTMAAGFTDSGTGANITSITKSGTGTWRLSSASSAFTGDITLNTTTASAGTLAYASAGGSNAIKFNQTTSTATLSYIGATDNTMSGAITASALTSGTITLDSSGAGAVNYSNTASMGSAASGNKNLILSGTNAESNILAGGWNNNTGGAATITKNGFGKWTLSGTNNYTGTTVVNAGTLQFAKEASLQTGSAASWTAANINVKSGATFAVNVDSLGNNGFSVTNLDTLLTNISVANTAAQGLQAGATLGFDTSTADLGSFTQGNLIANSTGANGGFIGVTKLGTGTLILDKTNTYTGATAVNSGTLQLSATGSITSDTTVSAAAALGGDGAVTGTASFADTSIFAWNLDITDPSDTVSLNTGDTFAVSGNLIDGGSAGGSVFKILLSGSQTFADTFWTTNQSWNNVLTSGNSLALETLFTSFNYENAGGTITGPTGGSSFSLSGTTLNYSAVPEPTSALAGLLLGAGLLRRRRKC